MISLPASMLGHLDVKYLRLGLCIYFFIIYNLTINYLQFISRLGNLVILLRPSYHSRCRYFSWRSEEREESATLRPLRSYQTPSNFNSSFLPFFNTSMLVVSPSPKSNTMERTPLLPASGSPAIVVVAQLQVSVETVDCHIVIGIVQFIVSSQEELLPVVSLQGDRL